MREYTPFVAIIWGRLTGGQQKNKKNRLKIMITGKGGENEKYEVRSKE